MTNKEIIIDGVDVTECEYLQYKGCEFAQCLIKMASFDLKCEANNCYYKQLARKTQECKKLNNEIIDMNSIIEDAAINLGNKDFTLYDLPFEIKKLSQECENLKAEEKYLKQCCQKVGEELAKHSFEYDGKEKNLVVQAIELNEKYEKLKNALEEIEEVIDSIFDRCLWRKTDSCMPVYNVCEELIKPLISLTKLKEKLMHNNQLDKFIETLIEEMSTKQLWKLVFNKMTNAAKRQMLGEMLNTLMGSGYPLNGLMFDYNPKEINENMHKENKENLSKEQDEFLIKANKLLASLEEMKELNTKALIENKIETLSTIQSIIISCIKEVEGQYYSKAVEEVFYSMVEQLGRAIKEEQNKLGGNNNETTTKEN